MIDAPIAQLVRDLEERGLLDRTLIVLASEFSRDMMVEGKPENGVKDQVEVPDVINDPKHYGMHRHFTAAGSVLLFGGGMKRGHVHGITADERPCRTLKDPVIIPDLHATIYPRPRHPGEPWLRHRKAAVLRDRGWQGPGRALPLCLNVLSLVLSLRRRVFARGVDVEEQSAARFDRAGSGEVAGSHRQHAIAHGR
jgi:hypothetical protein